MPQAVLLSIPIPNDSEPWETLDLYAWNGSDWQWIPHTLLNENERLESRLDFLPELVAVVQTSPTSPVISAEFGDHLPQLTTGLTFLEAPGLFLISDGFGGQPTIGGTPAIGAQEGRGAQVLPILVNEQNGVVRDDLTHNILVDETLWNSHIAEIVSKVIEEGYPGIIIAYHGIDSNLEKSFIVFIAKLAQELHAADKILGVQVGPPLQVSPDTWDTGGYNWQALAGNADADLLRIPAPTDPNAYAPGGTFESFLDFATGLLDRSKIQPIISTYSQDLSLVGSESISYTEGLARWGGSLKIEAPSEATTGEALSLEVSSVSPIQFLEGPRVYVFNYTDDRGTHTVYLEDAQSLAHKLRLVASRNLGGASIAGLAEEGADPKMWATLQGYEAMVTSPQNQFALVLQVKDAEGNTVTSQVLSGSDSASWEASEPGDYTLALNVSDDGGQTTLTEAGSISVSVANPIPTPQPQIEVAPTPTPRPVVSSPAPAGTGFDYGIQVHPYNVNLPQLVGWVQGLGFRWVKFQVPWPWLEPVEGQLNFNAYGLEDAVNAFSAAGIKILFSVVQSPDWSRPSGRTEGPPDNYDVYADRAAALAAHFAGRVQAIEIMNETNLPREWPDPNAAAYVDLLCRSYARIKAANSAMIVVSGAPTPTGGGFGSIDDRTYLTQMYQTGRMPSCSDAVGVHPSGYISSPDAHWPEGDLPDQGYDDHPSFFFLNTIQDYHNIMCSFGDCNTRLWSTEFGWASSEGIGICQDWSGCPFAGMNTEQEQANWTVRAYEIARASGYMGVMFLWNLNFGLAGLTDGKPEFGIIRPDGNFRPAYNALASMPK